MIVFDTNNFSGTNFSFPDIQDHYFEEIRRQNPIVLIGLSEIEKIKTITCYVHNLFEHNGDNQAENPDPLWITEQARQGKKFRCVEYASVTTALMWAYEIPARSIGLRTADVEIRKSGAGHIVNEVWVSSLQKWIMVDVQENILFQSNDELLSCIELLDMLQKNKLVTILSCDNKQVSFEQYDSYIKWIQHYLYYFVTRKTISFPLKNLLGTPDEQIMLVPIDAIKPQLFQGVLPIYSLYTNNVKDFYPNL